MSRKQIPSKYLDTVINIYRNTGEKNAVGEVKLSPTTVYASLPANIQPQTSEIEYTINGVTHIQTHACYINRYSPDQIQIKETDIVSDTGTGKKFIILGIEEQKSFTTENSTHIKLILKHIVNERYNIFRIKNIISKARIK